jgi:hypothetical protein
MSSLIKTNSIAVYQALPQTEKILNETNRPDLVYSRLSTIDLLLRQVKKEGIGIIFSHDSYVTQTTKQLNIKKFAVLNYDDVLNDAALVTHQTKLFIICFKKGTPIRVSDIESVAKLFTPSADVKWIAILHQAYTKQLFKWDLRYS